MAADCFRLVGTMTLAKKGTETECCVGHLRMFRLFPNYVSVLNNFVLLVDKHFL